MEKDPMPQQCCLDLDQFLLQSWLEDHQLSSPDLKSDSPAMWTLESEDLSCLSQFCPRATLLPIEDLLILVSQLSLKSSVVLPVSLDTDLDFINQWWYAPVRAYICDVYKEKKELRSKILKRDKSRSLIYHNIIWALHIYSISLTWIFVNMTFFEFLNLVFLNLRIWKLYLNEINWNSNF